MVAASIGNRRTCSFETSPSCLNVNHNTKSETTSNETKRNRRKRPLRSCAGRSYYTKNTSMNTSMNTSTREFSLDTITEFPYLEDKFSSSFRSSLFSLDDDNISTTSTTATTKNSITENVDMVLNALNMFGTDCDSEEESDDDCSMPSVASISDDESEDSKIREDVERSILRVSRWGSRECNSSSLRLPTRSLNNGDCAPTCPVRRQ